MADLDSFSKQVDIFDMELKKLGLKIKRHEDQLELLKSEIDQIDKSLLHLQVNLGKYHSTSSSKSNSSSLQQKEEEQILNIINQEGSAAAIISQIKFKKLDSMIPFMKDIIGVVANLAKTPDHNLSWLLSEYLGQEIMLAIVCKTNEGLKKLECYSKEGNIDISSGLHGLGPSIGKSLNTRFYVLCLEKLRPFGGKFVANDAQRRLALNEPRLANGEAPPGFIGFAVNMVHVDHMHLSCVTLKGHGLRETLFYHLFAKLQVYKTRNDMFNALGLISEGAISLDGGIIKNNSSFYLGFSGNVEVKFPVSDEMSKLPLGICEIEEQIKILNLRKEIALEDIKREEFMLNHVWGLFRDKKHEMQEFLDKYSIEPLQMLPSKNTGEGNKLM